MAITKNETFVTSDGHVFSTYEEAYQHENHGARVQLFQNILDAYQDTLDDKQQDEGYDTEAGFFEQSTQHLAEFMTNYKEEV